ncbi:MULTISPECIES: sialate O-acetylesterase [Chitinophagaceae]
MKTNSLLILPLLFLGMSPISAQIKLPRLIRDSMVLQRDTKIRIWGWASIGEKITVRFADKNYKTITGKNGKWQLYIQPMTAGGPYVMELRGRNRILLTDILVGDVWVCSGQSNMEHQMKLHANVYATEIAQANYPDIRQFKVPNVTSLLSPQEDLPSGYWKSANPIDVNDFSAVAYFFAKQLYEKYHVPIGIINTSWGGSPIEAWMSEPSLKTFPSLDSILVRNKDTAYVFERNRKAAASQLSPEGTVDQGLSEKWLAANYQPKGWRRIAVPGYWEDQGMQNLDGIVWYKKDIAVPENMAGLPAELLLGRIVDADIAYVNGQQVGSTGYLYPQRRYTIPKGILRSGKNSIVVRVTNYTGKGGFVPDKPYRLHTDNGDIELAGYWQYKVGAVNIPVAVNYESPLTIQYQPTALYNAMIAPLENYSIKGFAWYQGESNAGKPDHYAELQEGMITEWRRRWDTGTLPFVFVQLPGFMDYNYLPSESQWAKLREAQAKTLALPNTGMVVAIDLGEWNDVHPDKKKEVGDRLALAAEHVAYGENIVASGPTYLSNTITNNKITIKFSNIGNGLATSDGHDPQEFAIAGADKKFVWANAKVEGDKVVLWNDKIARPKYVRYAWADNPVNPNLINGNGLPAAPFRTDH